MRFSEMGRRLGISANRAEDRYKKRAGPLSNTAARPLSESFNPRVVVSVRLKVSWWLSTAANGSLMVTADGAPVSAVAAAAPPRIVPSPERFRSCRQ